MWRNEVLLGLGLGIFSLSYIIIYKYRYFDELVAKTKLSRKSIDLINSLFNLLSETNDQEIEESSPEIQKNNRLISRSWIVIHDEKMVFRSANLKPNIESMFSEADMGSFQVRGLRYANDKKKTTDNEASSILVHLDLYQVQHRYDHIARSRRVRSQLQEIRENLGNPYIFLVNIQIPGTPCIHVVLYWVMNTCESPSHRASNSKFYDLFDKFIKSNDAFRNERLKLIPSVVEGPWSIKTIVGSSPILLGQRLNQRYFEGDDYFEVDIDIKSNIIARQAVAMCLRTKRTLVIDLAFVIQANVIQELPEKILSCVRLSNLDVRAAEIL